MFTEVNTHWGIEYLNSKIHIRNYAGPNHIISYWNLRKLESNLIDLFTGNQKFSLDYKYPLLTITNVNENDILIINNIIQKNKFKKYMNETTFIRFI